MNRRLSVSPRLTRIIPRRRISRIQSPPYFKETLAILWVKCRNQPCCESQSRSFTCSRQPEQEVQHRSFTGFGLLFGAGLAFCSSFENTVRNEEDIEKI
ncbi:hypothetical protein PO124_21835 [Bacillus licheniformis]|nr:hypothetical protein [Bacillus licheniformis]